MSPGGGQALVGIDAPRADTPPLGERLAATPRLVCEAFCRAINDGDLDAALACFSADGCLVWADGTATFGETAMRQRLDELISVGARIEIEIAGVIVAGDLALAHERWRISYGGKLDQAAAKAPGPTMVLRLIAGEWRIAIAAPWGAPASEPLRAIWP